MKLALIACLISVTSSAAFAWENQRATDTWGDPLEDKWGNPVYVDSINGKPVDADGWGVEGQDIRSNGGFRYDYDKPIYDSDGFKAKRWGND
jgi:hypothetical protein